MFSDIRYNGQHIPSLTLVWVAANSFLSCPCEHIQTMFGSLPALQWENEKINQTDRVDCPLMIDMNCFHSAGQKCFFIYLKSENVVSFIFPTLKHIELIYSNIANLMHQFNLVFFTNIDHIPSFFKSDTKVSISSISSRKSHKE